MKKKEKAKNENVLFGEKFSIRTIQEFSENTEKQNELQGSLLIYYFLKPYQSTFQSIASKLFKHDLVDGLWLATYINSNIGNPQVLESLRLMYLTIDNVTRFIGIKNFAFPYKLPNKFVTRGRSLIYFYLQVANSFDRKRNTKNVRQRFCSTYIPQLLAQTRIGNQQLQARTIADYGSKGIGIKDTVVAPFRTMQCEKIMFFNYQLDKRNDHNLKATNKVNSITIKVFSSASRIIGIVFLHCILGICHIKGGAYMCGLVSKLFPLWFAKALSLEYLKEIQERGLANMLLPFFGDRHFYSYCYN